MKGISDILFIMLFIFVFGISLFFGYAILDVMSEQTILTNNTIANATINQGLVGFQVFDASILFLAVGMGIAAAISAFFIRTHPIFFIFSFTIWVLTFVVAAVFSNIFAEFAASAPLVNISLVLTNTVQVITNFPQLVALIGFLILIALYAKGRFRNEPRL